MDWICGIQRAIYYIEDNLTETIDYEKVAAQSFSSSYHFQRVFSILCGFTVGEYIHNRRLSLAGSELAATDAKVIDVALKYGYESPESFTRAFVRFHGITPSEAKKSGAVLKSCSRLSVQIVLKGGSIMDYKIIEKDAFCVIERAEQHSIIDSENKNTIPDFWTRARGDGTLQLLREIAGAGEPLLGICHSGVKDADEQHFTYGIGVPCAADVPVPPGFRRSVIPADTWAVFGCTGAMPHAIQDMLHRIYTEFLPAADWRVASETELEVYYPGDMADPAYYSEIRIPVIRK
jgi:AraC family transcriptional regulator